MENPFEILREIQAEQVLQRALLEKIIKVEPNTDDSLITQKEACEWARLSEATWIKWRNKGRIPFKKIGGRYLYNKQELMVFITSMKGGSK
jgi:excisionase family DNA binding protein